MALIAADRTLVRDRVMQWCSNRISDPMAITKSGLQSAVDGADTNLDAAILLAALGSLSTVQKLVLIREICRRRLQVLGVED